MQPFAEAIVRKIKDIENRGSRMFTLTDNDGQFEGCRCCIKECDIPPFDYEEYGKQFVKDSNHCNLPKYGSNSDFKYHKTASLIKCGCKYKKRRRNATSKATKTATNKRKKYKIKPLPNYNSMTRRRKPSRKRTSNQSNGNNQGAKYNYFGHGKPYNLRTNGLNKERIMEKLIAMGYDRECAVNASQKFGNVREAIEYLSKLQKVSEAKSQRLGYKTSKKRKFEPNVFEERGQRNKRRKIMSDYDEKEAIDRAVAMSISEQTRYRQSESYNLSRKRVQCNDRNKNKMVDLTMDDDDFGVYKRRSV